MFEEEERCNRRNRAQAAHRAWAERMGHPVATILETWAKMPPEEVAAWEAAGDAAVTYGFRPITPVLAGTACAGTVLTGEVFSGSTKDWPILSPVPGSMLPMGGGR